MKNLKKFIVHIIILFISFGFFVVSNFVFAEGTGGTKQCSACNATPSAMQAYINFEVELLESLQEMSAKKETLLNNPNSGLFAGGFSLGKSFIKSTTEKVKKNLDSEVKATRAAGITTVLLAEMFMENGESAVSSITILFKDKAFVRDYKILQELDMSVNDVIWDMGMLGIRNDKVSSQAQTQILGLQSKYSQIYGGEYPIFSRLSISGGVRNRQLLNFILQVNGLMKYMLSSVHNSVIIDGEIEIFESQYSRGNIIAEINRDYIEAIQSEYSCATMRNCNETVVGALTGIFNTSKLVDSFGRSRDTIKDSIDNLKELKNPRKTYTNTVWDADNAGGLTERQVELLRTVYGLDSKNLTTSQIEKWKKNWSNIEKNLNNFSDFVKSFKKGKTVVDTKKDTNSKEQNQGKKQAKKRKQRLSEQEKAALNNQFYWQSIMPKSYDEQAILNKLQDTVNDILVEKSNDKEILLVGLNLNTHYFVEIGSYIHFIVETVIGDRNNDGLINNLEKACIYQCSNNGTQNCSADN